MGATRARLGDLLRKSDRWITLEPETTYQEITVRVNGKGIIPRGTRAGMEIGGDRRLEVRAGQFIISRIDARHGASGIIPQELDKGVVTNAFPVFDLDHEKLNSRYLHWLSKTHSFVESCKAASEGTTNRVRLREKRFANIEISLPALTEQERIASKIDSIFYRIEAAKRLRNEIQDDANALLHSVFHRLTQGAEYRPLAEVAPIVRRPVEIDLDGEYPELGVRSFGKGVFHKPVLAGVDVGTKKLYYIRPGDLVFSNVFAWEGAIAVVRPPNAGRVGSHRFITCVPESGVATADFLCFCLLTQEGMEKVREASPGGAGRNRTLGLKKLAQITVPVPPNEQQMEFDSLQRKFRGIRLAHADNQTEFDALLPAVLDKAFKSKL